MKKWVVSVRNKRYGRELKVSKFEFNNQMDAEIFHSDLLKKGKNAEIYLYEKY